MKGSRRRLVCGLTNTGLAPWKSFLFTTRRQFILFPLFFSFFSYNTMLIPDIILQVEQVKLWFEEYLDCSKVNLFNCFFFSFYDCSIHFFFICRMVVLGIMFYYSPVKLELASLLLSIYLLLSLASLCMSGTLLFLLSGKNMFITQVLVLLSFFFFCFVMYSVSYRSNDLSSV